jgi:SAM-dependent MidA family methyltransferase
LHKENGGSRVWTILEGGAGEGFFAAEVLATLREEFTQLYEIVDYVIDEMSQPSRSLAARRLQNFGNKVRFARLAEAGTFEGIVFANELLDALPVHRVKVEHGELREFYVSLGSEGEFVWDTGPLSDERLQQTLKRFSGRPAESQILEVNLAAEDWLRAVARQLSRGYVVLVDYGAEAAELLSPSRREGSLRSIHRHQFVNGLLTEPGANDITATVNWTQIKDAANSVGFRVVSFQPQSQFLLDAGFVDELEARTESAVDEGERASLRSEAREMILPGGMSDSFQVLVLSKRIG